MDSDQLAELSRQGGMDHLVLNNEWLRTVGKNMKSVLRGVQWSAWIPVPFGYGGPWGESSHCLADWRKTDSHIHLVNALQYMFLATAMSDNGTPSIKVRKATNPRLYEQVLKAYVCVQRGIDKAQNEGLVNQYVSHERYFDPQVVIDLEAAYQQVDRERSRRGRFGGGFGGGTQEQHVAIEPAAIVHLPAIPQENAELDAWAADARRMLEEYHMEIDDLPEQAANILRQFRDLTPAERWVRDYLLPTDISLCEEHVELYHCSDYTTDMCQEVSRRSRVNALMWPLTRNDIMDPVPVQQQQQQQQQPDIPHVVGTTGILPKVHTTFFRVTDKLALFRFCVLDPRFSLTEVNKQLKMWAGPRNGPKIRTVNSARGGSFRLPQVDPFSDLRFLGDQHVVNRTHTDITYVTTMNYFHGYADDSGQQDLILAKTGDMYSEPAHVFHISQSCTLERCLGVFEMLAPEARGDVASFRAKISESELRHETGYAEGFEWYMLHPDQCFWAHRQDLGKET